MTRPWRIALVTIGLIGAGLICGALAGAIAFAMVSLIGGERLSWEPLWIGIAFGGPLGSITAPVLSWLLLRRVPLGQMFLVCSTGTAIGGVGGWLTGTSLESAVDHALLGAFAGCLIAAIVLWLRTRSLKCAA
jgi:hypothetical protein